MDYENKNFFDNLDLDSFNENSDENSFFCGEDINKSDSESFWEKTNQFLLCSTNNSTNNSSNPNFSNNINESQSQNNFLGNEGQGKEYILAIELVNENKKNEKIKKIKRGRKTKEESKTSNSKRNKYAKDNIFRKIKANFINDFIINLINANIKSVFGYQKYLVRKFNREIVTDATIQFNLILFNLQLRNLLNKNISDKYTTVNSDANKEILEKLEKNEKFDKILNFTIKEAYEIFLSEDYEEVILREFEIDKNNITFNNMKGVITKLREEENEDDVYLRKLEHYFINIYSLMDESKIRKQRKEKLKLDD